MSGTSSLRKIPQRSSNSPQLSRNGFLVAVGTALLGIPSFVVLRVVQAIFDDDQLAEFVSLWSISNTISLCLSAPFMSFASHAQQSLVPKKMSIEAFGRKYQLIAWLAGLSGVTLFQAIRLSVDDQYSLESAVSQWFFMLVVFMFQINNAVTCAKGDFKTYCFTTAMFATLASLCFLVILRVQPKDFDFVFVLVGISFLFPLVPSLNIRKKAGPNLRWSAFIKDLKSQNAVKILWALSILNMTAVVIINGPTMIGKLIGASSLELVTVGGLINLVLVLAAGLNALTPPIQNHLVRISRKESLMSVLASFNQLLLIYVFSTLVVSLVLAFALNDLNNLYLEASLPISWRLNALLVLGIGLFTASGLCRILLTILNSPRAIVANWALGLCVFAVITSSNLNPISKLVVAPSVAFGAIFFSSYATVLILVYRRTESLDSTP